LAGLWGEWTDAESGEQRLSCTVITTGPNSLMDSIPHHRCPLGVCSGRGQDRIIRASCFDFSICTLQ
jgi:putative SOS response-associated peptidase YedK